MSLINSICKIIFSCYFFIPLLDRYKNIVAVITIKSLRNLCANGESLRHISISISVLLALLDMVDISTKYVTKSWSLNWELKQITTSTTMRTSPNKRFNCRTVVVHVRYKSLLISQPTD